MYPKYPTVGELERIPTLDRYSSASILLGGVSYVTFCLIVFVWCRNFVLDLTQLIDLAPFTINVKASVEVDAMSWGFISVLMFVLFSEHTKCSEH